MRNLTITEALAEVKTLEKRIASKASAVKSHLVRQDRLKDPLEKQGGSQKYVAEERQAIADLENNIISIRTAIQKANNVTSIIIDGTQRTITEWLAWRKDVAPKRTAMLTDWRNQINANRAEAQKHGLAVVGPNQPVQQASDVIVNIDEKELLDEIERTAVVLSTLDGQLSLKNATVTIEI